MGGHVGRSTASGVTIYPKMICWHFAGSSP
jgi:hypothetical protein